MKDINELTEEEIANMSDEDFDNALSIMTSSEYKSEEQPIEDSSNDDSGNEEVSDQTEEQPIEDSSNDEVSEQIEEQPVKDSSNRSNLQPEYKTFRANGQEFRFSDQEIQEKFPEVFAKAQNYTKKMQEMSKHRKTLDIINQGGLSNDDINLFIDAKKGDKGALSKLMRNNNIDPLDLDIEENVNYKPNEYGRDDKEIAIQDVLDKINTDVDYERTRNILNKEWDDSSWGVVSDNPNMILSLHNDVKDGTYNYVQSHANKLKTYYNGTEKRSDLEWYGIAANDLYKEQQQNLQTGLTERVKQIMEQNKIEQVRADTQERANLAKEAPKRAAAALPRSNSSNKNIGEPSIYDLSDEEYDKLYEERMARI